MTLWLCAAIQGMFSPRSAVLYPLPQPQVKTMKSLRSLISGLALASLALCSLAATLSAQSAPPAAKPAAVRGPCTNILEAACKTTAGCSWLPGYNVVGGTAVASYCRTAPSSLTAARRTLAAPAPKP